VTHDQVEAMSMSDEIAIMRDGKIEQVGPPKTLYFHPATKYTAEFIGRANLLPARVLAVEGTSARVRVFGREYLLANPGAAVSPNDDVAVMLRPESVSLNGEGPKDLEGTVRQLTFAGTTVEYVVDVDGVEVLVTELGDYRDVPLDEGMRVPVRLNADRMHVLKS
jgi:iron(III) transport system ATP-binding protein